MPRPRQFDLTSLSKICVSVGNNNTPQLGLVFVCSEKEENYRWTLNAVNELLQRENIDPLKYFVTDRELALIKALEDVFPAYHHIFCRYHVNINVVTKTKKIFTILGDWLELFQAWLDVIEATT